MSERALRRALLLLSLTAPGLPTAQAAAPRVAVGEVVVAPGDGRSTAAGTLELTRALRAALNDELTQLSGVSPGHPLVVSATLTKLSSEQRAERATATAAISLALRRADDQVLFAELLGRASAEEASGSIASVRHAALRGAVHGAVARLPEAVRRSR